MIDVAAEQKVPMISLAASSRLIEPMDAPRHWVFKTPQNDSLMADAVAGYMAAHGVKSMAFIGFNDAYGDGWLAETQRAMAAKGIKVTDVERFARTDTSVTGQVLKVMASKPDAVLIAGSGTPAALPQKALHERGYTGCDLPDARRGEPRFHPRRRQGRRGHDPAGGPGAGGGPAARQRADQGGGRGLHPQIRGGERRRVDLDLRGARLRCGAAAGIRDPDRAEIRHARHAGSSAPPCATRWRARTS